MVRWAILAGHGGCDPGTERRGYGAARGHARPGARAARREGPRARAAPSACWCRWRRSPTRRRSGTRWPTSSTGSSTSCPSSRPWACRRTCWPGPRGMADPRWPGRLRALARAGRRRAPPLAGRRRRRPARCCARCAAARSWCRPSTTCGARTARSTAAANAAHPAARPGAVGGVGGGRRLGVGAVARPRPRCSCTASRWPRCRPGAASGPRPRAAQGWADDDVVVAIVANLRANKDYPTLFAAAADAPGRGAAAAVRVHRPGPARGRAARVAGRPRARRPLRDARLPRRSGRGARRAPTCSRSARATRACRSACSRRWRSGCRRSSPRWAATPRSSPTDVDGAAGAGRRPRRAGGGLRRAWPATRPTAPGSAAAAAARAEAFDIARTARIVEARYRSLVAR